MGFGEDLLSTTRLLYKFTQRVCERQPDSIGETYDMNVADLARSSQEVQSALRALKQYFPEDLKTSFESIDTLASSIHRSYLAALQYQRPYSPGNPCGLSIDYKYVKAEKTVKAHFEGGVRNIMRLVPMGMLLVHHFVLEFTLFMCAVSDVMHEKAVLDIDTRDSFTGLMREIGAYMKKGEMAADLLIKAVRGDASIATNTTAQLITFQISSVLDVGLPMKGLCDLFKACENDTSLIILRLMYYSFIGELLDRYNDPPPSGSAELEFFLNTDDPDIYQFKQLLLNAFETRRYFEDGNLRQTLLEKFMGATKDPVYHYATVPYVGTGGTDGQMVMQNVGGNVSIIPRVRVHVWRKKATWNRDKDWKTFALVHGEAALIHDLMYNMVPMVLANRIYARTNNLNTQCMHMMLTRFFGPCDVNTLFLKEPYCLKSIVQARELVVSGLETLQDPVMPNAVSIQPMPDVLKTWLKSAIGTFDKKSKFKFMPSNAVVYRPTSINLNDLVRNKDVDIKATNVVWTQSIMPSEQWNLDSRYSFNTMFLFHYGNFLSSIHTLQEQIVMQSQTLSIGDTEYKQVHKAPTWKKDVALVYENTRYFQTMIKKKMAQCTEEYKKRQPPFLSPLSWVSFDEVSADNSPWVKCEQAFDLYQGTYLNFTPSTGAVSEPVANLDQELAKGVEHIKGQDEKVDAWGLSPTDNYAVDHQDISPAAAVP